MYDTEIETSTMTQAEPIEMTGAEILVRAMQEQGVETIFGYPGGAVLPIYDALYQQEQIHHVLVRHEQGAGHAAEGYARSTGKCGVLLVTSGPGATNAVTALVDALMDSIPLVCITGQVPSHLIGSDAFQECDTTGITRSATKHNYLVKDVNDLERIVHEAFQVATTGRPGPVLIDIPKDVQFKKTIYRGKPNDLSPNYRPPTNPDLLAIEKAVELMASAKKPIFYTGGGVINAGPEASKLLRQLAAATGFPVTSTLMGLGSFPASDPQWLGMLGMHGAYEANMAMHDCDVMICLGARFDDRVTGRLDAFSPNSKKIHVDIDPSSINKNVRVDIGIVADAGKAIAALLAQWQARVGKRADITAWNAQIDTWRARQGFAYRQSGEVIKPQYAVERLYELTKDRKTYITTEVG
ncbi:MAG: thiamine pyrophosphate-binding protein, partial [Hyphomonadaceae bacterium]